MLHRRPTRLGLPLALSLLALLLTLAASLCACGGEEATPVEVQAPATAAAEGAAGAAPIVMTPDGRRVDPETARAVGQALQQIRNGNPEPPPAEAVAAARDASELYGRWNIRHVLMRTNGQGGPPSRPLAPTTWEFLPGGRLLIRGANSIDAQYTYTGPTLVVSGFGPSQSYRINELNPRELSITAVIGGASLRIENTTVFDRAEGAEGSAAQAQ